MVRLRRTIRSTCERRAPFFDAGDIDGQDLGRAEAPGRTRGDVPPHQLLAGPRGKGLMIRRSLFALRFELVIVGVCMYGAGARSESEGDGRDRLAEAVSSHHR